MRSVVHKPRDSSFPTEVQLRLRTLSTLTLCLYLLGIGKKAYRDTAKDTLCFVKFRPCVLIRNSPRSSTVTVVSPPPTFSEICSSDSMNQPVGVRYSSRRCQCY
jgi:hypothetical protein